jgi:hypothetical protein
MYDQHEKIGHADDIAAHPAADRADLGTCPCCPSHAERGTLAIARDMVKRRLRDDYRSDRVGVSQSTPVFMRPAVEDEKPRKYGKNVSAPA